MTGFSPKGIEFFVDESFERKSQREAKHIGYSAKTAICIITSLYGSTLHRSVAQYKIAPTYITCGL